MAGYRDIDPGAVVLPHGIERRARAVRELGFRAAGEHGGHPARPDGHRPMSHAVDAAMKPLPMAPMDLRPSRHARHAERLELPESRDPPPGGPQGPPAAPPREPPHVPLHYVALCVG